MLAFLAILTIITSLRFNFLAVLLIRALFQRTPGNSAGFYPLLARNFPSTFSMATLLLHPHYSRDYKDRPLHMRDLKKNLDIFNFQAEYAKRVNNGFIIQLCPDQDPARLLSISRIYNVPVTVSMPDHLNLKKRRACV